MNWTADEQREPSDRRVTARSASAPEHMAATRRKVTAVAADVTQVQGVGVAWGDHRARGALAYLAPGTRKALCPGRVRVANP